MDKLLNDHKRIYFPADENKFRTFWLDPSKFTTRNSSGDEIVTSLMHFATHLALNAPDGGVPLGRSP